MSASVYPAWPDYALPAPSLNDNLAQQFPDTLARTDFDQGLSRQRSLFTGGATVQWLTWPMSPTQLRIFHGFWANQISNGADWFTIDLFIDDTYRNYTCRFVGSSPPVKITRSGGEWMYAAQVETLDVTAPDEYETAELLMTYGTDVSLDDIVTMFHDVLLDIYQ